MERQLKRYPYNKSRYAVNAYSSYMFRETYERSWFDQAIKVPFGDTQMNIPADYDKILTHLYGDYMTPPENPEIKHNITRIEFGDNS